MQETYTDLQIVLIAKLQSKVPISLNCVFDASLVPETCLELSPLPECGLRMRFGKLRPLNDMALRARR